MRPILFITLCLLTFCFDAHTQTAPSIFAGGIVNAASYSTAPLAPGSIASAFGDFLLTSSFVASGGTVLPTNDGGLSLVFAGGQLAPLFYASGAK